MSHASRSGTLETCWWVNLPHDNGKHATMYFRYSTAQLFLAFATATLFAAIQCMGAKTGIMTPAVTIASTWLTIGVFIFCLTRTLKSTIIVVAISSALAFATMICLTILFHLEEIREALTH
jgi:hypothetical protein